MVLAKLSKCVVSFQMTQNDTCVIQMTQMTQHKTTQKFFFTYLINFRKYHCYWRFLSKICQKNWNFFFWNFFWNFCYNIFENLYSKKKKFCVFLCCVILCHSNDTCVVSFEWHKWHNTGQSTHHTIQYLQKVVTVMSKTPFPWHTFLVNVKNWNLLTKLFL